jgi:hypothetical protein
MPISVATLNGQSTKKGTFDEKRYRSIASHSSGFYAVDAQYMIFAAFPSAAHMSVTE